ncbi:hypothetical protein ACHAPJ_012947 [Fusarium lateritium]
MGRDHENMSHSSETSCLVMANTPKNHQLRLPRSRIAVSHAPEAANNECEAKRLVTEVSPTTVLAIVERKYKQL